MGTNNTMSRTGFALRHLLIGAVVYHAICAAYLTRLQLPFSGRMLSWEDSVWLSVTIFAIQTLLCIYATIGSCRNSGSIFLNILLSAGPVFAIMAYQFYPIPIAIAFILCVALTAYYSARVLMLDIPDGMDYFDTLFRRIGSIVQLFRRLASFAVFLCIVLYCYVLLFGAGVQPAQDIRPGNRAAPTDKYELFYPLPYEWYYFECDCLECVYFGWDCLLEFEI
jgi:hypothetical protein